MQVPTVRLDWHCRAGGNYTWGSPYKSNESLWDISKIPILLQKGVILYECSNCLKELLWSFSVNLFFQPHGHKLKFDQITKSVCLFAKE